MVGLLLRARGWATRTSLARLPVRCRPPVSGVKLSSAPSLSSAQIYEAQPDISRAFQTREFIPLPRLLAMVMVTTVPPPCNKIMFTQALNVSACLLLERSLLIRPVQPPPPPPGGRLCPAQPQDPAVWPLQLDSTSVRCTALGLLLFVLKRALRTVDCCLSGEAWQRPGVYTAATMEEFARLFREALSKVGAGGEPRAAWGRVPGERPAWPWGPSSSRSCVPTLPRLHAQGAGLHAHGLGPLPGVRKAMA